MEADGVFQPVTQAPIEGGMTREYQGDVATCVAFQEGSKLAGAIPGGRFLPLKSKNHVLPVDEPTWSRASLPPSFDRMDTDNRAQSATPAVRIGDALNLLGPVTTEKLAAAMVANPPKVQAAFKNARDVAWDEQASCMFCAVARMFRPGYVNALVQEWLPALDGVVHKLEAGAKVADRRFLATRIWPRWISPNLSLSPITSIHSNANALASKHPQRCSWHICGKTVIPYPPHAHVALGVFFPRSG